MIRAAQKEIISLILREYLFLMVYLLLCNRRTNLLFQQPRSRIRSGMTGPGSRSFCFWIPAFAGMTIVGEYSLIRVLKISQLLRRAAPSSQ